MTAGQVALADAVRYLVSALPGILVESLAAAVGRVPDSQPEALQAAIHAAIPQPRYRALAKLAQQLVGTWKLRAPDLSGHGLAFALLTAAKCEGFARTSQALSLVWTGPDVEAIPPRRTDQALLQLIESAKATLTIVSFVAYKVPHVSTALAGAARRGLAVRLILEDAEASQGKVAFDALKGLGAEVAERCAVYIWPIEKRQKAPGGKHGSLHAKCAIADGLRLLISSANLTEHALSVNIELGVLVKGGALPARAESYWTWLIQSGVLSPVTA
jgi:phosphatidylserine/phosphatidylglycerophosphate/cardiolipin synthase-like enzyme